MSPRAACRLIGHGFEVVYDYVNGITDWMGAGLPFEGEGTGEPVAGDVMRSDIPTCRPDETIAAVRAKVEAAGWEDCIVLECEGLAVGRLRQKHWSANGDSRVEDVMEVGPSSVRFDEELEPLVKRMDRRPTPLVVVTTPQGQFLGVVLREDAHRLLAGEPLEKVWTECDGCRGHWRVASSSRGGRSRDE